MESRIASTSPRRAPSFRAPLVGLPWIGALTMAVAVLAGCDSSAPAGSDRVDAGTAAGTAEADAPDAASSVPADYAWPEGPRPTATLQIEGRGDIVIELYPELAPKTVANFIELAEDDFYDDTTFHRVLPGYMIQGGDPNTRDDLPINDGQGGPGYRIDDEISGAPHLAGVVSMANTGRHDTGGSQFFILTGDAPGLDALHTIFGRVIAGQDLVEAISQVETDQYGRWGPKDRPIEDVVVEQVVIDQTEERVAGG